MSDDQLDGTEPREEGVSGSAVFGTARGLIQRMRECSQEAYIKSDEQVVYLWACVTRTGFCNHSKDTDHPIAPLTLEDWLNVVDESATLGANWLILTVGDPLHLCPDVWELSRWAQESYGMTVGLHPKNGGLCAEDLEAIKQLDINNTRLLLREEWTDARKLAENEGIIVWTANPQPPGERPHCKGGTRMIFVNEHGILYTCGVVEGNSNYHLGHVLDKRLKQVVTDPKRPRWVEKSLHVVSENCDGCPARMAVFFS
ncbi:MAG TPA: hypothetical protein PLZ53_00630 [Candidatus Hydrogenedentes bacterium]|nr:MAG: hypothetical protein BWY07_01107 [Candidatus Hydrogenedentes bacterium ADurb.Bin170]HNZ47853.1 hypothetical protein [Candidatus Hydrogenedentota bacterium]HOD94436.1 hypothetical protein [Candidatus Hydrogenedentota bacterium]HOH41588.1 hypothetical protein [Candidatus Hydrogenedentota bacterium]HOM47791.1 hypothetical protein [Candidatus Hydrogenedentota bacterium]